MSMETARMETYQQLVSGLMLAAGGLDSGASGC